MTTTRLEGKVAIVTGASRGIGRAIAVLLAREGASLVLAHRADVATMAEVEAACVELGAKVTCLHGDVCSQEFVDRVLGAAEKLGRVDVLINNAGVAHDGLLATLPDESVQAMVETNVLGVVRMSRAVIRPMLRQRSGCIINLSSILATRPDRGNSVYAGTKGFVEAFTKALAIELGRKQIRVLAVAPGVIDTRMSKEVRSLAGKDLTGRIALGRMGTPDDVARVVVFLASEEAAYMSGTVVGVDGAFGASG